jgi:hypothetical protein
VLFANNYLNITKRSVRLKHATAVTGSRHIKVHLMVSFRSASKRALSLEYSAKNANI